MGRGEGFGKVVLIGDAFVQFGVPAIVSAIPSSTVATVSVGAGSEWHLEDWRSEVPGYKEGKLVQQEDSIRKILEAVGIDYRKQRISISLSGDLIAGSGIGASAASCVALARALNDEFRLGLGDEEINRIAFEGEKGYHGDPGGIDNTASTYGGMLWFRKDPVTRTDLVEKIPLGGVLKLIMANSGISVNTAEVVRYKKALIENSSERFKDIFAEAAEHANRFRNALTGYDPKTLGGLMNAHHNLLRNLKFSHHVIETLIDIAMRNGALGAKLTGGGMGGFMVALAPEDGVRDRIAGDMKSGGFRVLKVDVRG